MMYVMVPDFTRRVEYCPAHEMEFHYVWTRVKLKGVGSYVKRESRSLLIIRQWVDKNSSDLWGCYINAFYFRDPKDATAFALRWA